MEDRGEGPQGREEENKQPLNPHWLGMSTLCSTRAEHLPSLWPPISHTYLAHLNILTKVLSPWLLIKKSANHHVGSAATPDLSVTVTLYPCTTLRLTWVFSWTGKPKDHSVHEIN